MRNPRFQFLSIFLVLALILTACAGAATEAPTDASVQETEAPMEATEEPPTSGGFILAFMPKFVGHPVFNAANEGAQAAAQELGDTVNYVGPSEPDTGQQVEWVGNLTTQGVDGIMIGALDPNALVPSLQQARDAGITVVSWDADVAPEGRTVYVSPPADEALGEVMAEIIGEAMNYEGQWAWLSSGPDVANQVAWIDATTAYMEAHPDKFGNMEMVRIAYGQSEDELSYTETEGLLAAFPDLKGIIAPDAAGFPAAARAVQDGGKCGQVAITGLALPSSMRSFVEDGCVTEFALWDFFDLGYLTVYTTHLIHSGEIQGVPGETFTVGNLGERTIREGGVVVLGDPLIFNAENIDNYDF
jgi:rhamnose transport system substrate-binding protein